MSLHQVYRRAILRGVGIGFGLTEVPAPALSQTIVSLIGSTRSSGQPARTIRVGTSNPVSRIAEAAALSRPGDIIEVEAGVYLGDTAVWNKDNITIRAVGGRARLVAHGVAAEGKAIWVVRAENFQLEGFDFSGSATVAQNGAGIRFEYGSMVVRHCTFLHNQNGILTGSNQHARLDIEYCEFGHNGHGDGQSHNLYVGRISRLSVIGSYFHHARAGHLLKSRAAVNLIHYNRLTDESDGRASYELEFPNGGTAFVIGNTIQQGPMTENQHLMAFGAEGYIWPQSQLYLVNNTLLDDLPRGGNVLRLWPGASSVLAVNNIIVGNEGFKSTAGMDQHNNYVVPRDEFENYAVGDFRLKRSSRLAGKAIEPGNAHGRELRPSQEYVHPRRTRPIAAKERSPGATQTTE